MGLTAVTGELSLEGSEGVSWVRLSRQREQPGQFLRCEGLHTGKEGPGNHSWGRLGAVGEQIRACERRCPTSHC